MLTDQNSRQGNEPGKYKGKNPVPAGNVLSPAHGNITEPAVHTMDGRKQVFRFIHLIKPPEKRNAERISDQLRAEIRSREKHKKQKTDNAGSQICGQITVKVIFSVSCCKKIIYDPEKIADQINIHKAWNEGKPPVQVKGKIKMVDLANSIVELDCE